MPGPPDPDPRALPESPSLRHLKLEAKRRLAAGEFPALADSPGQKVNPGLHLPLFSRARP